MAEASIPVDLFNPGQVFACLGFMEAVSTLMGQVEAAFDWSEPSATKFLLRAPGQESPFARVLQFLEKAEVTAVAPPGSDGGSDWLSSWGAVEPLAEEAPYPFEQPASPATFLAKLRVGSEVVKIDHWGDSTVLRDAVKFWAGAGGYPGAALARDALELIRSSCVAAQLDPFALAAPQSSSFRLDWRRDYIPIDAGFSLNAHQHIETVGYPLVELLGAIGLTNARPRRLETKLKYRYAVVGRAQQSSAIWYPGSFLRAALGGGGIPAFPCRRFHMSLGWPGKEGQARSITTVIEEIIS